VGRLIVNADDFGLTSGVNRAILELHKEAVLTSTTLMARAAATDEAVKLALATPSLGVGCHVVLVDGVPTLPVERITTLTEVRSGHFQPTLGAFLGRLLTGRMRSAEIEAEVAAQIALLQSKGVALTHIDTHKHTHMFPAVLRPVLRATGKAGIRAVRNPFESAWSLRATPGAAWVRRREVSLLRRLEPEFRRIVADEGFLTTDGAVGVLATGTLDVATVACLLDKLPPGDWELVSHPGYNDATLAQAHTRLLAAREIELEALRSISLLGHRELDSLKLINFAQIAAH
jgi:predicted glycoside hydrolase/deacetylase ChbG (UPF0249 family)